MSEGGKATGAIAGITNFLLLAFILPGFVYFSFFVLLFGVDGSKALLPQGLTFGTDVAVGLTIFLGLVITSIAFAMEIIVRAVIGRVAPRKSGRRGKVLAAVIFSVDRKKDLGWYFWQLWGQTILHLNIWLGLFVLYVAYKFVRHQVWPPSLWLDSWKDLTFIVIVANFVCWLRFSSWFNGVVAELTSE